MPDGRKNNGGARQGAGRKRKDEEQVLIERLDPLDPLALDGLEKGLKGGKPWAIKLYFEYRYGKPKQQTDITSLGERINIPISEWQ